ncbi:MAG: deoxyhypusine synthase family protein, partial [Candidatus Daviesbacteria bacterium]|nr:deoxyhypusine synthase family protein [Candidatus Daviesbacteria bacterium]
GYNRVYDTIELEQNLDDTEEMFFKILDKIDPEKVLSSRYLNEEIGKYLSKNFKHRGILKSAYEKGVPVYVPAFTDSELGLDLALYNRLKLDYGKQIRKFDPFLDLEHYSHLIDKQKKIGIFTIGGGVPRNWAQQVTCYLDIIEQRKAVRDGVKMGNKVEKEPLMFSYGLRICPESVEWGGLSGCTYTEGISWGKFQPHELGSRFCEVPADATIVWPLILKSALEKLGKKKIKKNIFAGKIAVKGIEEEVEKNYKI